MNKKDDEKVQLLKHAWGHAKLKMFEDAVKDCEALVDLDKDDPHSYIELGFYYEKNGNIEQATDCYLYLMKRFPRYAGAYVNLGYIYKIYKKRSDIAMLLYEKALELNPEETWALNNVGTILQEEGKWEEALSYYKRASEMAQAEKVEQERANHVFHNLGWAYYRCKKYKEACEVFSYLAKKDSDNSSVFSDFGCVLYKMGKFSDSLASFEAALRLCGDSRYYKRLWSVASRKC